jgi:hypothetical protein
LLWKRPAKTVFANCSEILLLSSKRSLPIVLLATLSIIGPCIDEGYEALRFKQIATVLAAFAVAAFLAGAAAPALARKQAQSQAGPVYSTYSGKSLLGPFESINADLLDPVTAQLIWQLSSKPELMNLEYLNYYLGPPDNQTKQIGIRSKAYYWYDRMRQPRCELYQELDGPGEVIESQMVFHLPGGDLDFGLIEKKLGPALRNYFDHSANPTRMYCFRPNTTLAMSSTPNTFAITKATVTYMGPPLPHPDYNDIHVASDSFVSRTVNPRQPPNLLNWLETLSLAKRRAQENPADPGAHACLAEALRRTGNVHEAIGEYKQALALDRYNDAVRQQCIQGLKELFVLPPTYVETPAGSARVAGASGAH